ncbi:MAG TPA: Sec-independent protein translocase protein TatB [Chloroflexia bacterium]|nr:Sec-independent protein translocase protein TatB [Chloroflexia bacterium]
MGFEVFGVGVPEMVIIAVVALIFLGPEKLPDAARTVGGWVREIRSFTGEATSIWQETLQVGETIKDTVRYVPSSAPTPAVAPAPAAAPPVAYTAPAVGAVPIPAEGGLPAEPATPATLDYPEPFAAPAPTPTRPEALSYPAPFES